MSDQLDKFYCEINRDTGALVFNDVSVTLRPKTFELLLLLAANPGQVFSKAEILATVWQGSIVEEQVIFQSINEIRKETGYSEIIKTYPRRGYSWNLSQTSIINNTVTERSISDDENAIQPTPKDNGDIPYHFALFAPSRHSIVTYGLLFLAFVLLFGFYVVYQQELGSTSSSELIHAEDDTRQNAITTSSVLSQSAHKGLLVLPFEVDNLIESQKWLRYGAMEGLIRQLPVNKNITVFQLDDTIEILNRLPLNKRENIEQIFQKSGASHILLGAISGVPGEFDIVYTLYSRQGRATNTIKAMNVESALSQLAHGFETLLSENFVDHKETLNAQLQNDLIAKAIQFMETGDYESALTFIETAVINEPDNLAAHALLSTVALKMGAYERSLSAANKGLSLTNDPSITTYQHRLLYFKGGALLSLGKIKLAESQFLLAEHQAKMNKDWLYYAYTQSMLGKIKQFSGLYDMAYQRFNSALSYQEVLNCPMGISQGHLDLAELYLAQNNAQQAHKSFAIAKQLVDERNLTQVQPLIDHVQALLEPKE